MSVRVTWYCRTCKVYAQIPSGSYHYLAARRRRYVPKGHEAHDTLESSVDWDIYEGNVLYSAGPYMTRGDVLIDFNEDAYTEIEAPAPTSPVINRADLVTDAQRKLWDAGIHRWPECPQQPACYRECEGDCKPLSEWFG